MEKINHPKHYDKHPARIECIDVIEPFCFNLGSVIKYVWRAGLKPGEDDLDDLRKAEWYIKREIQRREYERLVSPKPKPQIAANAVIDAITGQPEPEPAFDAEKVKRLIVSIRSIVNYRIFEDGWNDNMINICELSADCTNRANDDIDALLAALGIDK